MTADNITPDATTAQGAASTAPYVGPTAEDLARIPAALTARRQWVLWRGADRVDTKTGEVKLNKIPIDPQTLHNADTTDPQTWGTFEECVAALPTALEEWEHDNPTAYRGGGLGFVFASDDPYAGADFDHCVDPDTEAIADWAQAHIAALASYTELSPSRSGLHVLVEGALPPKGRKKGPVELYDHGRFFTMTGWHLTGTPGAITTYQEALYEVHGRVFGPQALLRPDGTTAVYCPTCDYLATVMADGRCAGCSTKPLGTAADAPASTASPLPILDDTALLAKARAAKNAAKFESLWTGDTSLHGGDESSADMSLCILLAFWTQHPEQLDRLFRQSGLMRPKWDEKRGDQTYGERTIAEALARATAHYTPHGSAQLLVRQAAQEGQQGHNGQSVTSTPPYDYDEDREGLWLIEFTKKGEHRTQLTNFTAKILVDIEEDDGTTTHPRFFEVEATQGDLCRTIRLAAKDFQSMTWIADALGAKARVFPGKYYKEHAHAAIQDLSPDTERRHTYTHTGWREIEGAWCYLHGTGAMTADGMRKDLSVALGAKFERYRLPLPPSGPEAQDALRASLALRGLGPNHLMTYPLSCAYLAPLRQLLASTPPDFVMWLTGRTGSYKSEYAALALAHFGDFTRLTLPMTFETTGNGLERILHTPKDSLLVIDDYHPADSRREADTMAQVASRLLRGMGNMASRQRMRRDTTMQEELPPRCVALATGELVPNGHSNNARMFLVAVPPLTPAESQTHGNALTPAQDNRDRYAQAMAVYLQWIARHWRTLDAQLPARYAALRQEATAAGCHTREPGQLAYLQLAWETFTQCALDYDALSAAERTDILSTTKAMFLEAVEDHAVVLRRETTVQRFFDYLRDGFASKQIYVRSLTGEIPEEEPNRWGWTPTTVWDGNAKEHVPTYDPKHATLLGYVDEDCVYLTPKTLEQYLHQASRAENRPWPVDMTSLLRELEALVAIRTKPNAKGYVDRELQKKITGVNQRRIHLNRSALYPDEEDESSEEDDQDDAPF